MAKNKTYIEVELDEWWFIILIDSLMTSLKLRMGHFTLVRMVPP